jgi:AhpD family alkylhydroperoxidase
MITMSHARGDYASFRAQAADIYQAVLALGQVAGKSELDKGLLELVKIRASQINGCAFCVQHHVLIAEKLGVAADKLNLLVAWREAPQYSERERAALAWTEALTVLSGGAGDEVYAQARGQFSETELFYLTAAVAGINAWNRLGVAYRWAPPERPSRRDA